MQTLDSREEQNLLSAIKRAVDLVDKGTAPDTAITKIAKEEQYTPGKIKLVCAAYNTGRQTAQREENKNILDKFAEFPLACADTVISNIYGKSEKRAADYGEVDVAYARAPGDWYADREREKIARMRLPEIAKVAAPIPTFDKVMGQLDHVKHAAAESRRDLSTKSDAMNIKFAALLDYFRQPVKYRESFGTVEKIASMFFDAAHVTPLMDSAYSRLDLTEKYVGSFKLCGEKRASDTTLSSKQGPVDTNSAPYSLIRDCIKAAQDMQSAQDRYQVLGQKAQQLEANVISAYTNKTAEVELDFLEEASIFVKSAFIDPTRAASSYNQLRMAGMPSFGDSSELAGRATEMAHEIDSAEHMTELRKIKTQAMLNQFLTDSEDPISGYDPDRVMSAYNEIAAIAPRSAEHAGIMGPLLRRRLAGRVEPFEAGQLVETESGLRGLNVGVRPYSAPDDALPKEEKPKAALPVKPEVKPLKKEKLEEPKPKGPKV